VGLILGGVKQKTMKLVFVASVLNIQAIKNKHWLAQSQVNVLDPRNYRRSVISPYHVVLLQGNNFSGASRQEQVTF
jgi:hypothetical protein